MVSNSKTLKKVFVHIDAAGRYIGNGGFNMLTSFAQETANLGYETFVFCQQDSLKPEDFAWLCREQLKFTLTNVDHLLTESREECVIVTSWLQGLLYSNFGKRLLVNELLNKFRLGNGITAKNVKYWDQSELLRSGPRVEKVKKYCLKNYSKIAINNRTLENYYRSLGFHNVLYIENWIRPEFFYYDSNEKVADTIGHQPDRNNNDVYQHLIAHNDRDKVFLCEGDQAEVAKQMRKSDYYVFYNYPSPAISLFKGEVFGLSLFEAMACGCVCIAIEHEGNKFLRDTIILVKSMDEIIPQMEALKNDPLKKEKIRSKSIEFIETYYRFDEFRKESIIQLLEQ